ncbi:TORTIFOLIA1-like protein 5 isoform X2 [Salvia hispanica]|uniref:TORTIFOLIA1-like protein 5 isoform X2 n=1 Tax=Salvia hispanica TaxID=49212 RepID=UPI00200999C0|nr:TORTIFOLIA1-like protein 5 isoform X2 [Salvia hispanica]
MSASSKQARDLKHRVLTCLHKLSDRDTHAAAAAELESIARSLPAESLPSFISSISATDSSDKSPVRRHCLRLFSVLAAHHGAALSPHLSKILSAVARRLRDPDSSVRAACVAASLSLASHLAFSSVAKPFVEALFAEQEGNAQNGAALCLAAVVEGSGSPDVGSLRKLLPRLEKLAKCESFKAKGAILALLGSLVEVEGVLGGRNAMRNLIGSLVEFLSSEDWAARKAAAEALTKMAAVERDALSEYKASCLKTFEAKRFDKVKAARETMNQMMEAWKEIPDLTDEVSPKETAPGSKTGISQPSSQVKKISPHGSPASAARRRSSVGSNGNRTSPPMFRKLDSKKPSNTKVDAAAAPTSSSATSVSGGKQGGEEGGRFENQEIRRALFEESYEKQNHRVVVSNETEDVCRIQRDCEGLSLIRKQLVQIEIQQSNLLEILQRFTESSQRGIHSLEARVHGIELALDEISFDLAVSTGKMSTTGASCCSLPGADFLNLKMRKKTQAGPQASSQLRGTQPSVGAAGSVPGKNEDGCGGFLLQNRRRPLRGGGGVIVMNPLAEIPLQQVSVKGHA